MTNDKCAYCECKLNIESKDVTIDHFKPKVTNKDIVVKWENLFPTCLRCNRTKNRKEEEIVNPSEMQPKEHIGVRSSYIYRLEGKSQLGKNTIQVVGLNDIDRVITPRMRICEHLIERIEELASTMDSSGFNKRNIGKLEKILDQCRSDTEYSAMKATSILNNQKYINIKEALQKQNKWNIRLKELEEEMQKNKLDILNN